MQLKRKNNLMKILFVFLLLWMYSIYAQNQKDRFSEPVVEQANIVNRKYLKKSLREADQINLNLQNQLIKSLTHEAWMAVDTLKRNREKLIVNHYIKIYRTVPIYIPINDSDFELADTLKEVYLDSIFHRNIFKKLFKRK